MPKVREVLRRTLIRTAVSHLLFLLFLASGFAGRDEISGFNRFDWGGSFRFFATAGRFADLPPFFNPSEKLLQGILRLTFQVRLSSKISTQWHFLQETDLTTPERDRIFAYRLRDRRMQAADLSWSIYSAPSGHAGFDLDRGNIRFSWGNIDLTVGRQAVTFGKAYFWNPLDVFMPFKPLQLDRDYKVGVDAARLDYQLGRFWGFNVVAAAGKEILLDDLFGSVRPDSRLSWYGSALIARMYGSVSGWDLALQGGKIYGGHQAGFAASGEIGPLFIRFEGAGFFVAGRRPLPSLLEDDLLENHFQAVLGIGHVFSNGLQVEVEFFSNGRAQTAYLEGSMLRFIHGSNDQLSAGLLGGMMSYDILPVLKGRLVWIYSLSDRSSLLQPSVNWSVSNEAEITAGATFGIGAGPFLSSSQYPRLQTEFGCYPDILYLEMKIYF